MKSGLMIIGAGGHGRVAADVAALCGYNTVEFLDDAEGAAVSLAGKVSDYPKYLKTHDFFVAIGSNSTRRRIFAMLAAEHAELATLVHPSAVIGSRVEIGEGSVVMANAVINTGTVIGRGVILNTACSVDHDSAIGDFSHVSVGAHLAGTVSVGEETMVGAGAVVINNITVCAECTIGAGAVVVRNIEEKGTYIGVPARQK